METIVATSILATVTTKGREMIVEHLLNGTAFRVDKFSIGNGGHDTSNPNVALTPDVSLTTVPGEFFGPVMIDNTTTVNPQTPRFDAILTESEGVGEISVLGLFITVISVTGNSTVNVNDSFLFAIANLPLQIKTGLETKEFRTEIQF